jgi:hypothetical protein
MSAGRPLNDQELELLSAYLDGMLTADERAALETRLAAEPALRRELESLRQTVQLVKTLPPVRAPRNFTLDERMLRRRWLVFPATVGFSALSAAAAIVLFAFAALLLSQNGSKALPAPAAGQVAQMPTQVFTVTGVTESYGYAASPAVDTLAIPQAGDDNTADGRFTSPAETPMLASPDMQTGGGGPNAKSALPTVLPSPQDLAASAASVQQDAMPAPGSAPLTEEQNATLNAMNAQAQLTAAPQAFGGAAETGQGVMSNSAAPAQPPAPTLTGEGADSASEPPSVLMAVPTGTPTETPTNTPTATDTPTLTATHTATATYTLTPTLVPPAPVSINTDMVGAGLLVVAAALLVVAAGTAWTIWRRR